MNADDVPEFDLVRVVHDEHVAAPILLVLPVGYQHVAEHGFEVVRIWSLIVDVRRVETFLEHIIFVCYGADAGPCVPERHFRQNVNANSVAEVGAAVAKT